MRMATKKKKKGGKPRLEPLPRKRRRLMRLWTEKVHELHDGRCAICGRAYGDVDSAGKACFLNAHHIDSRNTNPRLRWDALNGILLCPKHHKFSKNSAHKGSIWFITWLMNNRRDKYDYIMAHRDDVVNINDRAYLDKVEELLRSAPSLKEKLVTCTTGKVTSVNIGQYVYGDRK